GSGCTWTSAGIVVPTAIEKSTLVSGCTLACRIAVATRVFCCSLSVITPCWLAVAFCGALPLAAPPVLAVPVALPGCCPGCACPCCAAPCCGCCVCAGPAAGCRDCGAA